MIHPVMLGVNIDHVATLRQARFARFPDASFFGPERAVRYIGKINLTDRSRDS